MRKMSSDIEMYFIPVENIYKEVFCYAEKDEKGCCGYVKCSNYV